MIIPSTNPFKLYIVTHTCTHCKAVIRKSPPRPGTLIKSSLDNLLFSTSQAGPCPDGCDTSAGSFNLCVKLSINEYKRHNRCATFLYAIFLSLKYLKYIRNPDLDD